MPVSGAVPAPLPARRHRLTISTKTACGLIVFMMAVVGVCGLLFVRITSGALDQAKRLQTQQLAYSLAATLGQGVVRQDTNMQERFERLGHVSELDFAVLTDTEGTLLASYRPTARAWEDYKQRPTAMGGRGVLLGEVQTLPVGARHCYATAVPVYEMSAAARAEKRATVLLGYLHVGLGDESAGAQLRYLQGIILLSCMAVIVLTLPIATLLARHITEPIQKLSEAARRLALGDEAARVELYRTDELGDLVASFNSMAETVATQRRDITRINAGLEDTVRQRTEELEQVNQRLQAEIAEKEDFLRAVSHDLNAPLRNISGMASMLLLKYHAALETDARQRLERIQKNVEIECALINELLELSRIKTRREKLEPVNLNELVNGVAEQLGNDLETGGIRFRIAGSLPVLRCEKARFRQAFQNLLDNAIKYMRPDGPREIVVRAEYFKNEVVLAVHDTGMGIAPEELPHLFHVFHRAKSTSMMKIPGKGVGLASVKSIVENYSGRLRAESVPGEGTTFFLHIPSKHLVEQKAEAPV